MQGPETAADADISINTLVLRGCDLILAAGTVPGRGVADRAAAYPKLRFVAITEPAAAGAIGIPDPEPTGFPANVSTISQCANAATSAAVQAALVRESPAG